MDKSLLSKPTFIRGVELLCRVQRQDERGYFERLYSSSILQTCGWQGGIEQVNHSVTLGLGIVRGMHYQKPPYAEYKLVSCLRGVAWDVVVDLRADSASFLQTFAVELSAKNAQAILIPPGCAHGFQALSAELELLYCHSASYQAQFEAGVNALDPQLHIAWPLPIAQRSPRDTDFAMIADDFKGVWL